MNRHRIVFTLIVAIICSCQSQQKKPATTPTAPAPVATAAPAKKFAGVELASKKDLACGMPLTAGLEDTVHYKGKIYGFCSAECKSDFVKNAAAYTRPSK